MDKCIACGMCAQKCPKKVDDRYNEGLINARRFTFPIPRPYPSSMPSMRKTAFISKTANAAPVRSICPSGAINFNDTEKTLEVQVGSVILAPGFQSFDPSGLDTYSYARLPDVVTSLEFERILSATGPYGGHLVRPSSMRGKKATGRPPRNGLPGCNVWAPGI